jgi:hypothetical protein
METSDTVIRCDQGATIQRLFTLRPSTFDIDFGFPETVQSRLDSLLLLDCPGS